MGNDKSDFKVRILVYNCISSYLEFLKYSEFFFKYIIIILYNSDNKNNDFIK